MRYLYALVSLLVFATGLHAQQVGMYNHYFFKPMIYNPAFAGNNDNVQATLISRSQWTGFQNAPQLNIFVLDGPVKDKKVGLGLTLISDRRGINQRTGGSLAYSYRMNINEDMHLSFGISAGIINQTIDFSKAIAQNNSDPTLFTSSQQKTTFDGNGGLAFVWKGLEIGASAMQLLGNKINYLDNRGVRANYEQVRHYTSSVKYKFYLSEEKGISIAPQVLLRIVPNTPLQYDGNLNLEWRDKFWVGATYKNNYAVSVNAGICIHKKLAVGYSYEFITASIGKYSGISHEVMVNFKFGGHKKETASLDSSKIAADYKMAQKDSAAQQRIDSLKEALVENQEKIKQLNKKLEQQAEQQSKIQEQTQEQIKALEKNIIQINSQAANTQGSLNQTNKNQNSEAIEQLDSKIMEEGVWVATYPNTDYKGFDNLNPTQGFYVIVGTFFYRDFAIAEAKRFKKRGYKGSNWLYSVSTKFNYVFTNLATSKQEAISLAKQVHHTGVKDAWVLELK